MDMSRYSTNNLPSDGEYKLFKHCKAIRENQLSVAFMIFYLHGYEIELHRTDTPLASAAQECLDELGYEGIDIWSCSTKSGGIWERWQRDALKYGILTDSYGIWKKRQ